MKKFCTNCNKDTDCKHTAELFECLECGEDFAIYIRADLSTSISTDVTEPSNYNVLMKDDVLTTIKTEGMFIVCQKCRGLIPPQAEKNIFNFCPACGRRIVRHV